MALGVIVVVGMALWFLLGRDGGPFGGSPEVPEFTFRLRSVEGSGITGAASEQELSPAAGEVRETLDELYVGGFVDPEEWEEGEFPQVPELFAGEATERARRNLGDLTLGDAAQRVTFVDPSVGTLRIRFLLGEEGNPFAAWATTLFRARGVVEDGGGVAIEHRGRYLLRPVEDRWLIVGYDVQGRLRPGASPVKGTP